MTLSLKLLLGMLAIIALGAGLSIGLSLAFPEALLT